MQYSRLSAKGPTDEAEAPLKDWGQAVAALAAYTVNRKLSVKVLDFVQLGGPRWTVDRSVFEMWLGAL